MACANSRCRYKNGGDRSPPPDTSYIDQLMIHKLCCPVPDVVHSLYPKHLILGFELFGDALTLGHLLYQQEHLLRRLFVDVGKVCIQPAAGHQFQKDDSCEHNCSVDIVGGISSSPTNPTQPGSLEKRFPGFSLCRDACEKYPPGINLQMIHACFYQNVDI